MSPPSTDWTSSTSLALVLLCAACTPTAGTSGSASGGVGGSGGAAGTTQGGTGGAEPEYHGRVMGWVVDDDGGPIAGLAVTLCAEVCVVADTDADGRFLFEHVRPLPQVLENIGYPGADPAASALKYTRFFDIVPVGLDEKVVIQRPYVVREVAGHQGPLSGPQQLELQGGLQVSFDADRIGTADNPLPAPAEELHFGAVPIPEAAWPKGGLGDWTILGAWGLTVWDLYLEDGFEVVAPLGDEGPLPPGTEVGFLVADYTYGFLEGRFFEEPAELTPDGTAVRTPAGAGLDRATLWLPVARPGP